MSVIQGNAFSDDEVDTGDIGHSLRCRSAASAYLSRTITTDATSTYFAAVKRGKLGVVSPIFDTNIKFNANDTLTAFGLTTTAVFRDPTSWLFIHVSNGGLYINGVSFGAVTTSALTNPRIGFDGTNYFDGYIARIGCVAGSSSAYTNFGQLNTDINKWVTKSRSAVKAVVDAGGTNSFMLDFDDATSLTTLGYDIGGSYSLNLRSSGTNTGTFTTNGGLAAAFDGDITQNTTASARAATPAAGYNTAVIGKDWGVGITKTITAVRLYGPDNGGFVGGTAAALTFKLQGSDDGSAWTDLTSPITGPATGANTIIQVTSGITTTTAYRHHRINCNANGTENYYMAEVEFYEAGSYGINHWTLNNFSLTAGTTYDHMLDVPGNSYATLNPIYPSAANITNGNLTSGTTAVSGTMNALEFASKWEVTAGGSAVTAGFIDQNGTTSTTTVTANKTFCFRLATDGTFDYRNVTDSGAWTNISSGLPANAKFWPYGITQAANWNFGQAPLHASATYQSAADGYFYDTTAGFKALCQANLDAAGTVIVSGTFTGNASADGPCVWMNGVPDTLTINGNAVTFGTHADKLATGFKLRTSSASYNTAGSNTWTATIDSNLQNIFKYNNAEGNP